MAKTMGFIGAADSGSLSGLLPHWIERNSCATICTFVWRGVCIVLNPEMHMLNERPSPVVLRRRRIAVFATLLAVALAAVGVATWAFRTAQLARAAAQKADGERDEARSNAETARQSRREADDTRRSAEEARDEALAAERKSAARADAADSALAFIRDNVLAAGPPPDWTSHEHDDLTLREALDEAQPEIAGGLAGRPLAEAKVRATLGSSYLYLGVTEQAVKQYERALELFETELGPDDPMTAACRNDLARTYRAAGRDTDASRLYHHKSADRKKP
jgi:tetratricopeptide (TPR) repeat protein